MKPLQQISQRVTAAAETILKRDGVVGPIELLQQLKFLQPVHFQEWLRGNESVQNLESQVQCGEKKLQQTYREFLHWATSNNLQPIEGNYVTALRQGKIQRPITMDGNPERERFFRTQFRSPDLTPTQLKRLETKQQKAPELTVFQLVSDDGSCSQCGEELFKGSFMFMELKQLFCLNCADLGHLEFLPRGDTALTRRTKKHSPLTAVVVRFNRARKRYERQGILATAEAIAQAETECVDDAEARAQRRAADSIRRLAQDQQFITEFTAALLVLYPQCRLPEASQIAAHTALRGSGRVGRSAAGRALDDQAVHLATRAWIRHQHTDYDRLLMQGVPRDDARQQIASQVENVVQRWLAD